MGRRCAQKPYGIVLVAAVLSGCSSAPAPKHDPGLNIDGIIAAAVSETAKANSAVAALEKHTAKLPANTPSLRRSETDPLRSASGAHGAIKINWNGPIIPLLERLAKHLDYQLVIKGSAPANPIIVTVTEYSGPAIAAVPFISNAAFGHASVTVSQERQEIALFYGK